MAGAADCRCRSPPLGEILHHVGVASPSPDHVVDLDADRHVPPCGRPVHFVLSFSNLTYSVPNPKRCSLPLPLHRLRHRLPFDHVTAKPLLSSISGEAREGEILAVLGASGSGKSTLIDALADRISKDSLKGSVTLNGEPLDSRLLRSISAYVMQDDLLFPMLTVEETLTFSAEFRLPRSLSAARKRLRVQSLIDQLGLRAAATTIIGDEGHRGISGGERRRVSIGVDIIHDPVILFLDEPTSGLDSSSAFLVVNVLRRIAESGSVVIMTVHQPSYRILGLLDHLIFLSRGEMVFSGGVGEFGEYFAEFGRPIPEDENKAEFALDLIRELENKSSSADSSSLVDFHRKWRQSRTPTTATAAAAAASFSLTDAISASISRGKLVSSIPHFANPLHIEVGVLTKRSFTNTRRMPELFAMRLATVLVTGFILATVFWRLDESPRGVQERLGFFAFAMSTMFYTCADALPVFLQERYIFARETAYNAYRRSSYVLSNSIVAFPPLLLLSLAFASTTFFAVGLAGGAGGFFYYLLIILASFWSGSGFVTFLSGVVSHVMVGYTLVVAILAYFLLFSGFFINRDRIPGYWIWFHYLSLVKYPYEGVLHNEFGREGECFVKGTQMFDNSPIGGMSAEVKGRVMGAIGEVLGVRITGETCFTTGKDVLVEQGIGEMGKWECLLVTVAWGFLFRLLFYLTLVLGRKDRRR